MDYGNFQKAMRFGDREYKEILLWYNSAVLERVERERQESLRLAAEKRLAGMVALENERKEQIKREKKRPTYALAFISISLMVFWISVSLLANKDYKGTVKVNRTNTTSSPTPSQTRRQTATPSPIPATEAESQYNAAIIFEENGQYAEAYAILDKIGDYKDSLNRKTELRNYIYGNIRALNYRNRLVSEFNIVGIKGDNTVMAVAYFDLLQKVDTTQKEVEEWRGIVSISTSGQNIMGLESNGRVVAVGHNSYGQLDVSEWRNMVDVKTSGDHTIGLRSDGTVVAIGRNDKRQCEVSEWADIVAISLGQYSSMGLKSDGTVVVAGEALEAFDYSEWTDIVQISAGYSQAIGLKSDGTVLTVGKNAYGACDVSEWADVVAIWTRSFYNTFGLKSDGTVVAAGSSSEWLDDISEWSNLVDLSVGKNHIVGLKSDGTVVATGSNKFGQCNVSNWKDIIAVAAGLDWTVGLKMDGSVVIAVDNYYTDIMNVAKWKLWWGRPCLIFFRSSNTRAITARSSGSTRLRIST